MLGTLVYKPELQTRLIIQASKKVAATILSIIFIIQSPYQLHQAHINMVKMIVDYLSTFVKGLAISYIFYLSIDFAEPSSFFYMNTFIVMVINVFAQTSSHRDLLKVKVTGYFYFIMISTSLSLVGCTFGVLWMLWIAYHRDQTIGAEKRAFIYYSYKKFAVDLMRLFIASSIYIYIKNVKKMAFELENRFFALEEEIKNQSISSDSHFVKFFCKNMVKILDINDSTLVDHNLKFKQGFLQTLYDESNTIKAFYEPMMLARKKEISYWKTYKKGIIQKSVEFIGFLFVFLIMRIKIIVIFTVYYWLYTLMTDTEEVQNIYQFSFLIWCIIYFMGIHRDDQIRMAAYFVFPCFIIFQAYRQITGIILYYKSDGRIKTSTLNTSYVLSVVTLMAYAFMLRYEQKKEEHQKKKTAAQNEKLNKIKDTNWALQKEIMYNIMQFIRIFLPSLRYLALLLAISAGLMNLNLPNSILILWSFMLLNNSDNDYVQWPRYFCFMIFLILNLYFSRAVDGKFRTLNVEIISVFGAYAHSKDLCNHH
jgi:hypothetical protein